MTPLFRKFLSMNWLMTFFIAGLLTFGVYSIFSAGYGDPDYGGKWNEQVRMIIGGGVIYFAIALFQSEWQNYGLLQLPVPYAGPVRRNAKPAGQH